jgi:ATP-binding protein involved in chromosome partitioning
LRLEGVKDVFAVASGKGGVGKSTTAGTLFLGLLLFFRFFFIL